MDILSGTGIIFFSFLGFLMHFSYTSGYDKAIEDMRRKERQKKQNI